MIRMRSVTVKSLRPAALARSSGMSSSRRATPSSIAACVTACATASTTRVSKTLGMMYSALRSSPTIPAIARAAASFIPSVILRARQSSAPRKIPGKASRLLIWFGKSLRPVPITATYGAATSGMTSGVGFAIAKTIGSRAIVAIHSGCKIPGALTPMKTSAPASTSCSEPRRFSRFVCSASHVQCELCVVLVAAERAFAVDRDHVAHARRRAAS